MSLRVLLADESASIKKVFQLGLQDFAAEVKSVQSGVDVIEVAESFQPDIIFADILLQKLNGYEVCLEIKQHENLKSVPFILMWSSFMELDHKKYQESGAEGEIEKPFEVDAMRAQIQQLVPATKEQHIASFLKFPSSITQEFIEEEKAKTPPESPPEAPEPIPTSPVDGMGVISVPSSPAVETSLDALSVPDFQTPDFQETPTSHWGSSEIENEADVENTSVFNRQDGDFEFETQDPEEGTQETEPAPLPAAALSEESSDAMDFSKWSVPIDPLPEPTEAPAAPAAEEILASESTLDEDDGEEESWQSTSLGLDNLPSAKKEDEASIDGFESVNIPGDGNEPLDLDSFLYKPGEDTEDDVAEKIDHVVVRDIEAIEADDDDVSGAISEKKIEALVAAQVKKQLSSEGIESLIRAHAQEIIKLNIIEEIPKIIEKIAREELDKLLKAEIAEAADLDSDS